MKETEPVEKLGGTVEIDETYVGGRLAVGVRAASRR